jgi:hypothetical protein
MLSFMDALSGVSFPDPILTANIYCSGQLDAVVSGVAAPFWHAVQEHDPDHVCYLWVMRYGRCGEHLKIRLHGPRTQRLLFERLLAQSAAAFLDSLGAPEPPIKKISPAPAIDVQDDADSDYPDCTILWTEYRRSPVSLAGRPFITDDTYVAHFTRCLGEACAEVIRTLAQHVDGALPYRIRQTTLLKLLIAGLAALGYSDEILLKYLTYHRDWLLRYLHAKSNADLARTGDFSEILGRFDQRLDAMRQTVTSLGKAADRVFRTKDGHEGSLYVTWQSAIHALRSHVNSFRRDPGYNLDPFATDPTFVPFFKVFHGAANQLGLTAPEEAFTHHLLGAATVASATRDGQ